MSIVILMIGGPKNLLSIGQHHNGLLQSINSVKTSLMKSRKWTGSFLGAKHACTTWFVIEAIGSSHVNVPGGYHCRFSTPKTAKQSLRQKRSNMLQRYLNNTDQISGLKKKPKNYCLQALRIRVHQMANSLKKQISWMFGLILVLLMKQSCVNVQSWLSQLTCIWKVQINTVDGLTQVSPQVWRSMGKHLTNQSCLKGLPWMVKAGRWVNLLEIPLLQRK